MSNRLEIERGDRGFLGFPFSFGGGERAGGITERVEEGATKKEDKIIGEKSTGIRFGSEQQLALTQEQLTYNPITSSTSTYAPMTTTTKKEIYSPQTTLIIDSPQARASPSQKISSRQSPKVIPSFDIPTSIEGSKQSQTASQSAEAKGGGLLGGLGGNILLIAGLGAGGYLLINKKARGKILKTIGLKGGKK